MDEQAYNNLMTGLGNHIVQSRIELWRLVQIVQSINPRKILEIGTANGGTLRVWQVLMGQEGQVYGVEVATENIVDMSGYPAPIMIKGFSQEEGVVNRVRDHAPFDFCFIDGDHSYEVCKQDWENYSAMIRPGGIVAFHDLGRDLEQEPARVFREITLPKESFYCPGGMGIGVVRIPSGK